MARSLMRHVLLYGAGGHARVCLDVLREHDTIEVIGALSDGAEGVDHLGVSVLDAASTLRRATQRGESITLCVAIGDNAARRRITQKLTESGHEVTDAISRAAVLAPSVTFGAGVQAMVGTVVQSATVLGRGVIVNTNASVDHDCTIGDFVHIAPGVAIGGGVAVGEGTLVGLGARLLPGVRVGANAVIGGGAVVVHDVPDGATVVGVPARPIAGGDR